MSQCLYYVLIMQIKYLNKFVSIRFCDEKFCLKILFSHANINHSSRVVMLCQKCSNNIIIKFHILRFLFSIKCFTKPNRLHLVDQQMAQQPLQHRIPMVWVSFYFNSEKIYVFLLNTKKKIAQSSTNSNGLHFFFLFFLSFFQKKKKIKLFLTFRWYFCIVKMKIMKIIIK
jgi:hypothetical protein